jgi:glycosyltransferase involved in cell wall biosynthesis
LTSVAIYDAYWATLGGGERHVGMIAQAASIQGHDVHILSQYPISLARLQDRLALDLAGVDYQLIGPTEDDVVDASRDFDLFVNGTYMSKLEPQAKRNVYLCFFPTPAYSHLSPVQSHAARFLDQRFKGVNWIELGRGWFPQEGRFGRVWRWSEEAANIQVKGQTNLPLVLNLKLCRPQFDQNTLVSVRDSDGNELAVLEVGKTPTWYSVALPPATREVEITCQPFVASDDPRELGVMHLGGRVGAMNSIRQWFSTHLAWTRPEDLGWTEAYDLILANSKFTQSWISENWNRSSAILYPPVKMIEQRSPQQRDEVILSIGRFMTPGTGHSKQQLEMVENFREIRRVGKLENWKLVLIGGCEPKDTPYLEKVRRASQGLPVFIYANAERETLERELTSASIFWSATGLGVSPKDEPWKLEHFGISTVEAMSAGCVPVVIDQAGQREIVTNGVDGFLWSDSKQWKEQTVRLAEDASTLRKFSTVAVRKADEFSERSFVRRWSQIAEQFHLL